MFPTFFSLSLQKNNLFGYIYEEGSDFNQVFLLSYMGLKTFEPLFLCCRALLWLQSA